MSQIVRQSNLFAGEDFTKIYKSFQDIDFTAYDFDTIKNALIEYIRIQFPEDFNDYIESSEFIAIIELLAYLGTSLAFRVDLNSRENIMDTAERRESIIRLARLINYSPKRNIAADGLFKISAILTNQPMTDSVGNSIANTQVIWGDPNNEDWFDQFVTITNNVFNSTNPFGKPTKSGTIGGIPTDLYELNNVLGLNVTLPISVSVSGEEIPIDIVNPDFEDGLSFEERHPDPDEAFNFIYRNDSLGVSSNDTGFFFYFKQGVLNSQDEVYNYPVPNRTQAISTTNINQSDVYFQEINDSGNVQAKWSKVPSVSGTNIIFNSINFDDRDIFEVISGLDDTITVKFPDGSFGNVPTGIYRYWYRTSIARSISIRPEDANSLQVTIPYTGKDNQRYRLLVTFDLKYTVANSSPAETNEQIKLRAPQTFYTQERMINNEDYNVFPLTYGNEIAKLRSINRTHSGHSRYIDINDPTGFNNGLFVLGEDGALYNDSEPQILEVPVTTGSETTEDVVFLQLQTFITNNDQLKNFFYNDYLTAFRSLFGEDYFDLEPAVNEGLFWKTSPDKYKNDTGFLIKDTNDTTVSNWPYGTYSTITDTFDNVVSITSDRSQTDDNYRFIVSGAILNLSSTVDNISVSVQSVINEGQPADPATTTIGPVEVSAEVVDLWIPDSVIPNFRTGFTDDDNRNESTDIKTAISAAEPFGLGYDIVNDIWYIVEDVVDEPFVLTETSGQIDRTSASCLIRVEYVTESIPAVYKITTQGTSTVFESYKDTRFYWDPDNKVISSSSGKAVQDTITLLPNVNTDASGDVLSSPVPWQLSGIFVQEDGYQDPAKVKIIPEDADQDDTPDNPYSFLELVPSDSEVIFERYVDTYGYERTRPWYAPFNTEMEEVDSTDITVVISDSANAPDTDQGFKYAGDTIFVPLSDADLFVFKDLSVIDEIAVQLTDALKSVEPNVKENTSAFIASLQTKSMRAGSIGTTISQGNYYTVSLTPATDRSTYDVIPEVDENHFGKNGISFTQDSKSDPVGLYYKWDHYAPNDQRIDPSISNIIDMVILTESYYDSVVVWKDEKGTLINMPVAPTTEELRTQFSELNNYKSISDQIIFNSGEFKLLFGAQAEPELQATFKAVKMSTASISDNELKTRIVQAIDSYFDITNWDFGERFFYTELAAFIHTQLSKYLSSVVIVPTSADSEFGNLFEIVSNPNQLFMSTATVDNVEIVANFTETNLRLN